MKMMNSRHLYGSARSISSADGIAPINGPKNGIIFVTPMIKLISTT